MRHPTRATPKPSTRRHFLKTACALGLGWAALRAQVGCRGSSRRAADAPVDSSPFGALHADPDGIIDLPDGFAYRVVSRAGEVLDDGFLVPGLADGMAAFPAAGGRTVLVRNHEVPFGAPATLGPFGAGNALLARIAPSAFYDPGVLGSPCLGGTTTVVYDTRTQTTERAFLSLIGTLRNCSGGPTPWGSWLSCEEDTHPAGGLLARDHGYVFEVPAGDTAAMAEPAPLTAMGRFNHEAVAVEPTSGIVFLSEDRPDGALYRFRPDVAASLREGGVLEALGVRDHPSVDTRNWEQADAFPHGLLFEAHWIPVDALEGSADDLRYRAAERGAAVFARGEGMWFGGDAIYFLATSGGPLRKGQLWRYLPSPAEGTADEAAWPGRLELFLQPDDPSLLENGDNVTMAPWGDLIVCEDGPGEEYLVGVRPDGRTYRLARNAISFSEFAGAVFSPDGSTLFVNIQNQGLTLAITGPW